MAARPSQDEVEQLKSKVFLAAKDNQPDVIRDCLASLHPDVVKDVLHHCYEDSELTPLIIAASKGHLEVVELLVNEFSVDVSQEISWSFTKTNALNFAIDGGHLNIVKVLVKSGCSLSLRGNDKYTPACLACRSGHLDILRYLVENGAKINDRSSKNGKTCLMVACGKNKSDIVKHLVSVGADLNEQDDSGRTALHRAAERNNSDIVALLLNHGANLSKDKDGLSPLIAAALWCASDSVHLILRSTDVSQVEKIDALELLGASHAETNTNEAVRHMSQGLEERNKNPDAVLLKPHSPLPTLNNVQESQTLEELQARQADQHLFRLECLAILRRILGPEKWHTLCSVHDYFHQLRTAGRHSEATALLLQGVRDGARGDTDLVECLIRQFAVNFADMLRKGINVFFSDVEAVMELILEAAAKNENLAAYFTCTSAQYADTWFRYVLIGLKVAKDEEEGRRLLSLGKRFIQVASGSPVLCEAVIRSFLEFFEFRGVDCLPYDLLISFLLHCGADIHASLPNKDTPLHCLVFWSQKSQQTDLFSRMLKTLLQAGALVGIENKYGKTPLALAGPYFGAKLRELYPVSLKSLAATSVVRYKIPYTSEVPVDLKEFVDKH